MKPHELIARSGRHRGKAPPPQMRDRNAAAAAVGAPSTLQATIPARRPRFPGETRQQELERLRANATIVRPGPAPAAAAGPPQPPPQPEPPPITMCACESHGDGGCEHVATLRLFWPQPDGGPWPATMDVCEHCAAAIAADPVGRLVSGLVFVGLQEPAHGKTGDDVEDDGQGAEAAAAAQAAGKVTP